ncbi:exo-beta-N-acetylmuramidase NamZ domain-containing protein [Oceanobacillus sp. 1P07AA]|uniref:exo-beta-N-acetylmuramidase NamZ family protein n=1 Tax=Oceanobacillus sp. 1P07AA TaxID=3132293 RepID=UPI0039A468F4
MKFIKIVMVAVTFLIIMTYLMSTSNADENTTDGKEQKKDKVTPGIEEFLGNHIDWVKGKKVGLITNPTGVDRNLISDIDLLYNHPDIDLTALFGPEHGIRGDQEAGEFIESYIDEETGLPVYSLYGPTWKPTEEMLEDVDVLLFDIQDISSNVYTYIYTLGFAMESAVKFDKELIVLDRPNPIGGQRVEGPLRSEETVSFMGRFLLPVRHGMTVGELATMWNHEYSMGVNLRVAEVKGWERSMYFEDTGLPWVMTSPNIPTIESAYLYAGTELLDDTTLSTGLGTTKPFELVGAPWVNGTELAEEMNNRGIPGVKFRSAYYTPMFGTYEGELLGGVQVHIDNPAEIDLVSLGLHLVDAMRDQNPDEFEITSSYANLIGNQDVPEMILNDVPVEEIIESWQGELNTWVTDVRNNYLLYRPFPDGTEPYEEAGTLGILPLDINISVGESVQLNVKGYDENKERIDILPEDIDWEVSGDIGYIESGFFHATSEGTGEIIGMYGDLTASRKVKVSTTEIDNIRYGVHSTYSRIVFDLNKTTDNYVVEESPGKLIVKIPFGEIGKELEADGGTIMINNSPVVNNIKYYIENNEFIGELNLKVDQVNYDLPGFSNRIVVDIKH